MTGWAAGTRTHAGVLVPWANIVVEAELHRAPGSSVTWHYAQLVPASRDDRPRAATARPGTNLRRDCVAVRWLPHAQEIFV